MSVKKLEVWRYEIYQRVYYSILPFCIWSNMWCCCRSQYEPLICQFCTKLLIKNKKVDKEIRSSSFLLWKFYLDTFGKIILNQCDKLLLPALIANTDENECRNPTVCSLSNCFKLKKDKIKEKMFLNAVKLM